MDYNLWIEPDTESGINYIRFSGKVAIDDENVKWILAMVERTNNGDVNYVNPLLSSNSTSNSEIFVGLHPILKSSE